MDINELINKKLKWLQDASEFNVVQDIATVCRTLGNKIENNRGILYYQLKIENITFNTTWSTCGFNPGIGDYNKKITAWVTIDDHCVCRLTYINDKPDFPTTSNSLNIESDNYIFIPGSWMDILSEKYKIAVDIVNKKKMVDEATRVAKLAAQMLIEPHVEV
jgi:hypothetical protein